MQKFPMTPTGFKQLQQELATLKSVERPKIIQAIAEARSQGDLSENADYSAAKEKQSFTEGRIVELEYKLSHAHLIDIATITNNGKVIFGTTVTLLEVESEEELIYQLVGDDEADVKIKKISINSPVAKSLIGKVEGDLIQVTTPGGIKEYELIKVVY